MELFLSGPLLHFCNASFPTGASVRDLVDIFTEEKVSIKMVVLSIQLKYYFIGSTSNKLATSSLITNAVLAEAS